MRSIAALALAPLLLQPALQQPAVGDTIPIPGQDTSASSQPFPPWESVRPDFANDPSQLILELRENETFEARGALVWMPVINAVTDEAVEAGAINPAHRTLFSNLLFGLISVETTGLIAQTGDFGQSDFQRTIGSFRGLSQLVGEKLYLEENPYEPLTAIRTGLRNLAPFVYRSQNIAAALAEHNNGRTTSAEARAGVDAFCTIGQEFSMRVINAAWWGQELADGGDIDYRALVDRQTDPDSANAEYYPYLPEWDVFDVTDSSVAVTIPDIPFNWAPPSGSLARTYIEEMPGSSFAEKQQNLINRSIDANDWTEDVAFDYPITDDPSTDKSACNDVLDGDDIVLRGIEIPDFLFSDPIGSPDIRTSSFDPDLDESYPRGALGTTPASVDGQHQYYIDGDIQNDIPGVDKDGNVYVRTPGVTELCGDGDVCAATTRP